MWREKFEDGVRPGQVSVRCHQDPLHDQMSSSQVSDRLVVCCVRGVEPHFDKVPRGRGVHRCEDGIVRSRVLEQLDGDGFKIPGIVEKVQPNGGALGKVFFWLNPIENLVVAIEQTALSEGLSDSHSFKERL